MSPGRRATLLLLSALALCLCFWVNVANGSDELRTAVAEGKEEESEVSQRTATGGIVNTLLCFLTVVAFLGNAAFLVYVFFYSK